MVGLACLLSHAPRCWVPQEETRFGWSARCYVLHKPTLRELYDNVPIDRTPRPFTDLVDVDAVYFVYTCVKHGS